MKKFNEEILRHNYLISEIGIIYHEAAAGLGISDSALEILYTVCMLGEDCSQADICRLTGISRQTINSSVRKLERDGVLFLERGNGKNMLVRLTDNGRVLAEEKVYPIIEIENKIFDGWTAEEKNEYLRLIQKFRDELRSNINEFF